MKNKIKKYYFQIKDVIKGLEKIDKPENIIYGVPKGGLMVCAFLRKAKVTMNVEEANLIVDDIVDSGRTKRIFKKTHPNTPFFALIDKEKSKSDYLDFKNHWIVFPWEVAHAASREDSIQENITRILQYIGEDPTREGLVHTPDRVMRMYSEIFRGYNKENFPKISIFKNGSDGLTYDQLITDEGSYHSHCEHHMVPFFGKYYFGYLPALGGNIIGLSKVARIVDFHASRLQIQERLVHDIVEDIWDILSKEKDSPIGMGIVMVGEHLCKTMRGVKKQGRMTTTKLKGAFLTNPSVKAEFLQRCTL